MRLCRSGPRRGLEFNPNLWAPLTTHPWTMSQAKPNAPLPFFFFFSSFGFQSRLFGNVDGTTTPFCLNMETSLFPTSLLLLCLLPLFSLPSGFSLFDLGIPQLGLDRDQLAADGLCYSGVTKPMADETFWGGLSFLKQSPLRNGHRRSWVPKGFCSQSHSQLPGFSRWTSGLSLRRMSGHPW